MSKTKSLIKEMGIKNTLSLLRSKLPNYHLPKILRDKKEYKEIREMIKEVESLCTHNETRTECVDYHRRDFGTICNDCNKILNTNG